VDMKEKVRKILERLDVDRPQVNLEPGPGYRIVAEVVSPSFAKMTEGERQRLVWSKLLDELDDDERQAIDTVFTNSPAEHEEAISGSDTPASESVP
jgi:acid stress-induced BolA-like protein IbaG/YrbA